MEAEWTGDINYNGKRLMTAKDFASKYQMTISNVHVAMNKKHPHVYKIGARVYVDEIGLRKRREFLERIWNRSHKNYYEITEHITTRKLAKILNKHTNTSIESWEVYMNTGLFSTAWMDRSLLHHKIPDNLWIFYRFTTFIIRRIIKNENRKIEYLNTLHPNRRIYELFLTEEQRKWFQ
jgi:hypothetical protein